MLASATPASAQESDSVRVSTVQPASVVRSGVVPAAAPLLAIEPLAADAPHRFLYDLGSTGFPHGVGSYGLRPEQQSLTLDGVPFDDLHTGRTRLDLLPLEALGPLGHDAAFGHAAGTSAILRPLPAPVARTELRYVTGQVGTQQIGALHAQDRRPGFVGADGRLGVLAHVSGRDAGGYYGSSDTGGFRALGRLRLLRPTFSVEVVEMQQRQTDEARSGVNSFDPATPVLGFGTSRETVRNDLWATARGIGLAGGAVSGTAFWTVQRTSFADVDTTISARGDRIGGRATHAINLGRHRLEASMTGWVDGDVDGGAIGDTSSRAFAEVRLAGDTQAGPLALHLEGAALRHDDAVRPAGVLAVRWPAAGLSAALGLSHAPASRLERGGGFSISGSTRQNSQIASAELALDRSAGPFQIRISGYALRQRGLTALAFDPAREAVLDSVGILSDDSALLRLGGEARLGWRTETPRGVYASVLAAGQQGTADSELGQRLLRTLPDYWARGQIGWKGVGLFSGVLDLDAAIGGRAWPAFQSLDFHAPSALFALPAPGSALVPASGTLDATITARVQLRATVFVLYQNALGARAVDGPYLVPIFPFTPHQLSFGVCWSLLN